MEKGANTVNIDLGGTVTSGIGYTKVLVIQCSDKAIKKKSIGKWTGGDRSLICISSKNEQKWMTWKKKPVYTILLRNFIIKEKRQGGGYWKKK